jgi:hypothetical protein
VPCIEKPPHKPHKPHKPHHPHHPHHPHNPHNDQLSGAFERLQELRAEAAAKAAEVRATLDALRDSRFCKPGKGGNDDNVGVTSLISDVRGAGGGIGLFGLVLLLGGACFMVRRVRTAVRRR